MSERTAYVSDDLSTDDRVPPVCSTRSTIVVAGLQAAALGFAGGVVIELGAPGTVGLPGTILLSLISAAFVWGFLYPGTHWVREYRAGARSDADGKPQRARWEPIMGQLALLAGVSVVLWRVWVVPHGVEGDLREPFALFSGTSAWPSQLLHTLIIVLFAWFLDYAWCRSASEADRIRREYFPSNVGTLPSEGPGAEAGSRFSAIRNSLIFLWRSRIALPRSDEPIDGVTLWNEYRMRLLGWPRLARVCMLLLTAAALIALVFWIVGGARPEIPARGIADRSLFWTTHLIAGLCILFLLVLVGDTILLTWRFVTLLKRGRTIYPRSTIRRFAAELGPELRIQAAQLIDSHAELRSHRSGRNSLLDDWIDSKLLGEHSAAIGPLIVFPFILVGLVVVARSRLFDNWQIDGAVLILFAAILLWAIAMAVLLNVTAETARRRAVDRMQADLIWLRGAGPAYAGLAAQFPHLIEQVRNLRQGAFAPFFEQPLVQALLVPLGGAGGVQLLDLLLFAR